jgi:DNA-binding transcriptional ArsR family regulator
MTMKTKARPQHLKLVKAEKDPELLAAENIFRSLVGAQQRNGRAPPTTKRPMRRPTFFMMDHDLLTALGRSLELPGLVLISELDRLVFTSRKNPVRLTNTVLRRFGLSKQSKGWWLRRLQRVGAIEVSFQGNRAPLVTWNNPDRRSSLD